MWQVISLVSVGLTTLVAARELDPAACAARFDVQHDKIIRTEESREMGARYISELDVGARHECLRLCCETDSCDVFVYEEKSPGSCYLFNCGPPEDFRCKFTSHGNFSSGVLALSRRLAELQDLERLATHEQELASLRGASTTTTSTTTTTTPAPPPPPPRPPEPPRPSRCSRYQFECRHNGECIAVYNACDGVPQCADGSDEAPELGCPLPPTYPPTYPPTSTLRTTTPSTHAPATFKAMPVLGEVGDDVGEEGAARWPHRLAQAQPPLRYSTEVESGRSPHIFSHKGGLVQAPPYSPYDAPWTRRLWNQQPEWGPAEGVWPEADPRRAWPVPPPHESEMPLYLPQSSMAEVPAAFPSQTNALRDAPKKGPSLLPGRPSPPPTEEHQHPAPIESTTKKKDLKELTVAPVAEARPVERQKEEVHKVSAGVEREMTMGEKRGETAARVADEGDGLSDHPPAAILLLVLGVFMTVVLLALGGCRVARRRRSRTPLTHHADYLVNGMYL